MGSVDALLNHIDQDRPAVRRGLGRSLVYALVGAAAGAAAMWIGFGDAWPSAAAASGLAGMCFGAGVVRTIRIARGYAVWKRRRRIAMDGDVRRGVVCLGASDVEYPGGSPRSVVVLLSFDSDVSSDMEFLSYLAGRVEREWDLRRLQGRRQLPLVWTDGALVVATRVCVADYHLRRGIADRPVVACSVEPGESGGVLAIPSWIPYSSTQESRSAAGNRR